MDREEGFLREVKRQAYGFAFLSVCLCVCVSVLC